jgi:hypothetical protein
MGRTEKRSMGDLVNLDQTARKLVNRVLAASRSGGSRDGRRRGAVQRMVYGVMLVLAGCVAPAGTPAGLPTVRAEARPGAALPAARGETQLVVRTVPADMAGPELQGSACRAESPYFTAAFASPAVILLPDYGSAAPPVTVSCRAGSASGTAVAQPEAVWSRGFGGWPAVGVSVGTGGSSGVGVGMGWYGGGVGATQGAPVVRYPELRVPVG